MSLRVPVLHVCSPKDVMQRVLNDYNQTEMQDEIWMVEFDRFYFLKNIEHLTSREI